MKQYNLHFEVEYPAVSIVNGVKYEGIVTNSVVATCYAEEVTLQNGRSYINVMIPTAKSLAMKSQIQYYLGKLGQKVEYYNINSTNLSIIITKEVANMLLEEIQNNSVFTDGWSSGNPGIGGWRITDKNGKTLLKKDYKEPHTNNYYEAAGLAAAVNQYGGSNTLIYTDSVTAIAWANGRVGKEVIKTYKNNPAFLAMMSVFGKHKDWIKEHVIKWDTETNGEIPADFGRKS